MFDHREFDRHEHLAMTRDVETGLSALVAIHSTALGPAFGGCRMMPYASVDAAVRDVLRLSRGMTYKAAICGLPLGGGESVILGDPKTQKTDALLRAMGRVVESMGGRYIVADDVGTSLSDLQIMRERTSHTAAATLAAQAPLTPTAYGVLMAIEAAVSGIMQRSDLNGIHVAVQGLGNVGLPLCEYLHQRGAALTVADINPEKTLLARDRFDAHVVTPGEIHQVGADVYAPCALGGVINRKTVGEIRAHIVCGGANNQLAYESLDQELAARGVVFIPDFLANAGGVIDFNQERIDDQPSAVMRAVEEIRGITDDVIRRAYQHDSTPLRAAIHLADERLKAARSGGRVTTHPVRSSACASDQATGPLQINSLQH